MRRTSLVILAATMICLTLLARPAPAAAPAKVKVGLLRLTSSAQLFIAQEKGFFKDEGLEVEMVFFKAAQPIALALAAREIDLGATGLTAGFYNALAAGLEAVVVADKGREWPGYPLSGLMASNRAWESGLRSLKDLKGRRVGVTQIGSTFHYMLGRIMEKQGQDVSDVRIAPLGGLKNMADAVTAGQIDAVFLAQPFCSALESRGSARLLAWAGDHLRYQLGAIFYSGRLAQDRARALAFMRAYIRACRFYHDNCLVRVDGRPAPGPAWNDVMAMVAKHTQQDPADVAAGLFYNDRDGQLWAEDLNDQVAWYKAHGLLDKTPDMGRAVDFSFWKEALAGLR